ncbi:MAG: hypothetical protein ABIV26_02850 [Candidatus Limnocylindrales bacterium]
MTELERQTPGMGPDHGPNDDPVPSAGAPSEAVDAPLPTPGGGLRDLGDQPDDPETQRRDELAERIGVGMPSPAGSLRPDVLPDIDPPDLPM